MEGKAGVSFQVRKGREDLEFLNSGKLGRMVLWGMNLPEG